ncbi:Fancl [Phodopus roborovskii]|uniref:Fancl protein n=1 Tax=Phodopus roborovskii TaxID=109678 RepID=A0AAV0A178_PHORO|nr:Fancl [Phodopus roborovskii]
MAERDANLLRHFPLLLPQNREKTVYQGFISAQGSDFFLRIVLPKDLQIKKARLLCSWQLKNILNDYHQIVQQRMKHSPDLVSFMMELKMILSSLVDVHSQFLAALESLKAFWDVMDEIDEKTWVLEPEKPPRSATARRIALGNNVSINIEVDPRHPTMLPEFCFLGADHVIKPLGIKLSGNIHLWDPENNLLQNLKDVLEIDFPARTVLEESDFSMDCGICYAHHLNGAIPDQVCDNPQCGQPFHQICLYEWLRGLSTSRQSFNILFGECPYCSKPITLRMSMRKS